MKLTLILLMLLCAVWLVPGDVPAESLTSYAWLTHHETTRFNEIIWFWTPDTFFGPVRSNDYIGLKYSPNFYDDVITTKPEFRYYQPGNIHFEHRPIFNAAPYNFPRELPHLRANAEPVIDGDNGRLITRVLFEGIDGVKFFQRRAGLPMDEERLVMELDEYDGRVIYIDGKANLEGIVDGRVTVAASDDIGLLNDIRYNEAEGDIGVVDPETAESMLGIVSDRNIIVRNTPANGRGNGRNVAPIDFDRHSIVINASLVALNGSFTFENQNDDWEAYQGPTPDNRGSIFLSGSTIQYRRGYIHRSNHTGTGYGKSFRYDWRLRREAPPGLQPEEMPELTGPFERLVLDRGPYILNNVSVRTLIVREGVTIRLRSGTLAVYDTAQFLGTEFNRIKIESLDNNGRIELGNAVEPVEVNCTDVGNWIEWYSDAYDTKILNSTFDGAVTITGNSIIEKSEFSRATRIQSTHSLLIDKSIFESGLSISGNPPECRIRNSNFIGSQRSGIDLRGNFEPTVQNCLFVNNRIGIEHQQGVSLVLEYSLFYANNDDFFDLTPGEGVIFDDPLFNENALDRYSLDSGSPCIDNGSPDSPRDDDNSPADIGARPYRHPNASPDQPKVISDFGLKAYPNPFNSTVTISLGTKGNSSLFSIFDLKGNLLYEASGADLKSGSFSWDATGVPAGIYVLKAGDRQKAGMLKLVKID